MICIANYTLVIPKSVSLYVLHFSVSNLNFKNWFFFVLFWKCHLLVSASFKILNLFIQPFGLYHGIKVLNLKPYHWWKLKFPHCKQYFKKAALLTICRYFYWFAGVIMHTDSDIVDARFQASATAVSRWEYVI